ncbi:HTH-type transcriptional regulator AscG [compost metagenome]
MQKIDACIVLGSQDVPEERRALAELAEGGFPFCLVNQRFGGESYETVDADHRSGSKQAVQHLIKQGNRHIAFVNGPAQYSNSADRLLGYKSALEEAGINYSEELVYAGNYSRKSGQELAEPIAMRIQEGSIDAIFSANDRMAIGLMQRLHMLGLEAGKDYALVGYDDSDGSRIINPRLSTVAVPFYEMGRLAAARLLDADEMKTTATDSVTLLPVSFIHRETS